VRRLAANAAILLLSLVLALGAAELAVRFAFRDVTTTTPISSWFGERWKEKHLRRIGGFRDRPFTWEAPPGQRRIVVIGDSFTVAMGLPEEQRYGNRIEATLNQEGADFRVLQFARPGQELNGHVQTLREQGLRASPDFVLLQFYVNDMEISKLGRPYPRNLIRTGWVHAEFFRRSALYDVANFQWSALQLRLGWVEDYASYMRRRYGDPKGESKLAMALLRDFFATCRREGIPVGMVLFPQISAQLGDDYPFAILHERVLAECARAGVRCVDLHEVYAPHALEYSRLQLNRFDHHASAFGHALAADALMQAFGVRWRALPIAGS
jgi:hypothetical protein